MTGLTLIVGVLLSLLGVIAYVMTGGNSLTALIPTLFGVIYIALALVARRSDATRRHSMHIAAVLSLIGIAANVMALASLAEYLSAENGTLARPVAVYSRCAMAAICAVHLIAAFRSFMEARLHRPTSA